MKLGNKVREYREKRTTLTQAALAEKLRNRGFRVSAAYLSQIECGKKKNISLELAYAICEEIGKSSSEVSDIFLPQNLTDSLKTPKPSQPK